MFDSGKPCSKIVFPKARDSRGAPPYGSGFSSLRCAARASTISGVKTWATLNMTGFVRLRSIKARS